MPSITLPAEPSSAIAARGFVRENAVLDAMRYTESDLLVTEVVANVMQHAPQCTEFELRVEDAGVAGLKVTISSGPSDGMRSEQRGMGHTILARFARSWGHEFDGNKLHVWFLLRTPGASTISTEVDDSDLFAALSTDPEISEELIRRHSDLATAIARRYRGKGVEDDDLEQVAHMALLKAIQRFDPKVGGLRPYAAVTISGELKKLLRDKGWSVRVPRSLQERALEVNGARSVLTQRMGRPPEPHEIADHLDFEVSDVLAALEAGKAYTSTSMDMPSPETGITLLDRIEDPDRSTLSVEDRLVIEDAITKLPERERHLLHLRFNEDMTQSEIAAILQISQMHVSRLLAGAIEELRPLLLPDEETG